MSGPEAAVHLLAATEVARRGYQRDTYVTVCGEVACAPELAPEGCPTDCDCEHRYCPACVRTAIQWSA